VLGDHAHFARQTEQVAQVLQALPADALVLQASATPYLAHPVALVHDQPSSSADRYALLTGTDDWAELAQAAGQPAYVLSVPRAYYRRAGTAPLALTTAAVVQGPAVRLHVDSVRGPQPKTKRPLERYLVVERAGAMVRCPVSSARTEVDVVVTPTGLSGCTPTAPPPGWLLDGTQAQRCPTAACVTVALMGHVRPTRKQLRDPEYRGDGALAFRRLAVREQGGSLQVLADGAVLHRQGVDDLVVTAAPTAR
jgi:hypothetical protein